jgi:DNA topoisomerase-1
LLEEKGIGRPSTFASLLDKIQDRGYATKQNIPGQMQVCEEWELEGGVLSTTTTERTFGEEKGKLVLQPLGQVVIEFLQKYFQELFQYDYTCEMEGELDKIAKGEAIWHETCGRCYALMMRQMDTLQEQGQKKYSVPLDEHRTYQMGKYGPVICDTEKKGTMTFQSGEQLTEEDAKKIGLITTAKVTTKETATSKQLGEYNGDAVWVKRGKFGLYMTWGEHTKNLKELGNRPVENVIWEDVCKWLEEGGDVVRQLNKCAAIRRGKRGEYLYWKTNTMKKPRFFGMEMFSQETGEKYTTCDAMMIYIWVQGKYNVNINT